ncbi:MAG: MgtC/SapB family protein [Alphaproteobacteria bacterium]|nr:MgtC/SapB family protein [Alphaproteobacteria bacterium]
MPLTLQWSEIALRIGLCLLASAAIGVNRGEQDRPVGLRTTMLVTLAAAISMIQVNLLLPIAGKPAGSFAVMDLMRLPLGILSGMGFIGAAAIVRRDDLVQGVTTAATLWFATVIGLCFGGGQIYLGLLAAGLAILILWPLKWAENRMGHPRHGELSIVVMHGSTAARRVSQLFSTAGFRIDVSSIGLDPLTRNSITRYHVVWNRGSSMPSALEMAHELGADPDIAGFEWKPHGHP